jgi:hypothetical protein
LGSDFFFLDSFGTTVTGKLVMKNRQTRRAKTLEFLNCMDVSPQWSVAKHFRGKAKGIGYSWRKISGFF